MFWKNGTTAPEAGAMSKKKLNNFFSKFIQENGKKNVSQHKILNDFCFLCFSCKKTKSYLLLRQALSRERYGFSNLHFFQILSHCEISDGFGYPKLGFQVFTINERNGRILLDIRWVPKVCRRFWYQILLSKVTSMVSEGKIFGTYLMSSWDKKNPTNGLKTSITRIFFNFCHIWKKKRRKKPYSTWHQPFIPLTWTFQNPSSFGFYPNPISITMRNAKVFFFKLTLLT